MRRCADPSMVPDTSSEAIFKLGDSLRTATIRRPRSSIEILRPHPTRRCHLHVALIPRALAEPDQNFGTIVGRLRSTIAKLAARSNMVAAFSI